MEAHVGDRIIVHATHQGEVDRAERSTRVPRARGRPALPGPLGRRRAHGPVLPRGQRGRGPHRPCSRLTDRTHGQGHRSSAGPSPGRAGTQRRPRRAAGGGQDHPGRGPAGGDRSDQPRRPGRGRHHRAWTPTRSRSASSARSPCTSATVEHAGHRITLLDTPGSPDFVGELRAGAAGRRRRTLRRLGRRRRRRRPRWQLWDECAARRHAAGGRGHPARPRRGPTSRTPSRPASERSAAWRAPVLPLVPPTAGRADRAGGHLLDAPADAGRRPSRRAPRELIEAVIAESEDESLMDRYLAGERARRRRPGDRPGDRGRPRALPPRAPRRAADRPRAGRAARPAGRAASRRRSSARCPR